MPQSPWPWAGSGSPSLSQLPNVSGAFCEQRAVLAGAWGLRQSEGCDTGSVTGKPVTRAAYCHPVSSQVRSRVQPGQNEIIHVRLYKFSYNLLQTTQTCVFRIHSLHFGELRMVRASGGL